ncbi:MAG: hypothetical protein ACTSQG_05775, partial [Promethearchaeota archaeon]
FDEFIKKYNLKEEETQEPVEFINFSLNNFEEMYYPFLTKNACKIAIGIRYDNPFISKIKENVKMDIPQELKEPIKVGLERLKENIKKINIKVIFNKEIIKSLLSSKEFKILTEYLNTQTPLIKFKNIDVRITEDPFSNFSLTDNELIQPSFDPTNKLIGLYISRNKNIYQIFDDKFSEIFEKGTPLNKFIQENKELKIRSLSGTKLFVLCIL